MKTTIVIEADRPPALRSTAVPAERPGAISVERPAPTCECPEYCLLDHNN